MVPIMPAAPSTAPAARLRPRCQHKRMSGMSAKERHGKNVNASRHGREVRLRIIPLLVQGQKLLTVNGHVARRFDPQTDLAAVDVHDRDADVVPDENLFSELPTEN